MATKFAKWGNSIAVRVPQQFVEEYKILPGMEAIFEREKDKFRIKPIVKKELTLEEIIQSIDPKNPHELLFDDTSRGKEIW